MVELGAYLGYSAIVFADAMKRAHGGKSDGLRVWSVELEESFAGIAREFVELAGLEDIVRVVVGKADEVVKGLKTEGKVEDGGVDVLFLDHGEDLYVDDFKVCVELGLLGKGAVVLADNVVRPGAPEYRGLMRSFPGVVSEGVRGLIQPGDYEVSKGVYHEDEVENLLTCLQDEIEVSHVVASKLSLQSSK